MTAIATAMGGPSEPDPVAGPAAYPVNLECEVTTLLGTTVRVRPIRPEDAHRLAEFHRGLSPEAVYFRFFSPHPRLSAAEIERFTHVDYADRLALIVEVAGTLVAVGRYDRISGTEAEVAFVVADAWHHNGIATLLLELLAQAAWVCGIDTFVASTLPENREMLGVFTHSRFDVSTRFDDGVVSVRFGIGPARHRERPDNGG
jgi:RimJ/RimL family protein N-acetyltransferase